MSHTTDTPLDWMAAAEQAKQAAEEGRWDLVRSYYERREARLAHERPNGFCAAELFMIDKAIEVRLLVARAAAAAALEDAGSSRRLMAQWRAKLLPVTGEPGTVSRRA